MNEVLDQPTIVWGHQLLIYHNRKTGETNVHLEEYADPITKDNPQVVFALDDVASLQPRSEGFKIVFRKGYNLVLPVFPNKWIGIRPLSLEHGETHQLVFCSRTHRIVF